MYSTQTQSSPEMTSADHHSAAADRHEEAARSHRDAAAHYTYGNYQQGNEHALLAKSYGIQAERHCLLAME
jgi:hypothetical protein